MSTTHTPYTQGRNAAWRFVAGGERPVVPAGMSNRDMTEFKTGVRHALAEERLSNDFEWDED